MYVRGRQVHSRGLLLTLNNAPISPPQVWKQEQISSELQPAGKLLCLSTPEVIRWQLFYFLHSFYRHRAPCQAVDFICAIVWSCVVLQRCFSFALLYYYICQCIKVDLLFFVYIVGFIYMCAWSWMFFKKSTKGKMLNLQCSLPCQ